ncbi:dnd system-associated protein 1 [Clostridiales bacterium oral taxon 876 str. F0540]|nr:dnd system-associated protein 1 [Clostridiales bacterium oral taxon 876 str. F0540]
MYEQMQYKLKFDDIKASFNFKEDGGLIHRQGIKIKILPYTANDKEVVIDFRGVVGEFSRMICNKELKEEVDLIRLIEDVTDEIGEFEGTSSKETFKDIIRSMFIDNDRLVDFNIKTINYISSAKGDDKISKFLFSIFFDDELKQLVQEHYDRDVENILYKLVLNALPKLDENVTNKENYKCYIPFIKDLFKRDFKFLIKNEELFKNSLKRLLEFYYMFYVSQLALKLSEFEKADLTKPDAIYYTLGWESTSKNRTAFKFGWDNVKNYVNSLFSHSITLELLNHSGNEEQLGYKELYDLFCSGDESEIENELDILFDMYTKQIKDKSWNDFKYKDRNSGNKGFDKVYKLFEAIEFQFVQTSRTGAKNKYNKRFTDFVEANFAKRRGALGYNLNLTEEDIILFTKICINDNGKLKLSLLFDEFEKRGIFFDRDSKVKIVQLYEKLNLLEKKSDSGDAQYVRSIL